MVYTLVSRIVGCAEDAEELAQDVFLKAFRNLHRFNGRSSFPTWLFRIAYNTASVQFEKNLRGYRTEDVDRFLDKVEEQLQQNDAQAEQLRKQIADLTAENQKLKGELQSFGSDRNKRYYQGFCSWCKKYQKPKVCGNLLAHILPTYRI